ncbi:MAG: shikimate dehydrogenase family protein, partial [Lactobacillaceae bacterium]
MQNAAFNKAKIPAHYIAFNVLPSNFYKAVNGMISLGIKGFNVSSPFKADIINYLDKIDPAAGKINSVNTVKITNSHLKGYSTDGPGFWQSLKEINTAKTLLIGTGGAARSIMANAANFGVKQLTVVNRYGT